KLTSALAVQPCRRSTGGPGAGPSAGGGPVSRTKVSPRPGRWTIRPGGSGGGMGGPGGSTPSGRAIRRRRRASSRRAGLAATAAPATAPPAASSLTVRLAEANGAGRSDEREAGEHGAERTDPGEEDDHQQGDDGQPALAFRQLHRWSPPVPPAGPLPLPADWCHIGQIAAGLERRLWAGLAGPIEEDDRPLPERTPHLSHLEARHH